MPFDIHQTNTPIENVAITEKEISFVGAKKHSTSSSTPPATHIENMGLPERRFSTGPAHAEHGPAIDHKIPEDDVIPQSPELMWSRIRQMLREPFAEFWGVFILIMFGDGVVAQVVLSKGKNGDYQSINWGWG